MVHIRLSEPEDGARIIEIWRNAVDATHDFLSAKDRQDIETEVVACLPMPLLWVAVDNDDRAIGFMLIGDGRMEALFVDAAERGSGIGRVLVEHALRLHPGLETDVNEQNVQAVGFYERMGFRRIGRSETDQQGRPYPLIHLRHAVDTDATSAWHGKTISDDLS